MAMLPPAETQDVPLLTTKLFLPQPRPNLVDRPRLIQRLDEGLRVGHRLTLVSAPAGSGKTTLLTEWVNRIVGSGEQNSKDVGTGQAPTSHQQSWSVAWLSLDDADNDPARFWTYVIAALQTIAAEPSASSSEPTLPRTGARDPERGDWTGQALGQSVLRVLRSPQYSSVVSASIVTPLLNEIAALSRGVILVLDDYHVISTKEIHDGISFVLDHQPQQLHLTIATRADPPLPIVRLRARGQMTEMRASDLRFTADEAAAFLNEGMGLSLSSDDVSALETRTEGWIVGLQLAALALQATLSDQERAGTQQFISAFTGSHHFILEYLTQEVLGRQPEPVQHFLLQTSILDRLCGPLCDAVCTPDAFLEHYDGAAMLAHLERSNLFVVPLDAEHRWYRYQHLFAGLLGNQLRKRVPQEQIAEFHRHASFWHETDGSLEETIKYARAAGDLERVAFLIEQNIMIRTTSGELTTLLIWIDALPQELVRDRPSLCITKAWASVFAGRLDEVEPLLESVEKSVRDERGSFAAQRRDFMGIIATLRAFIADRSGDVSGAIELAREADELLPETERNARSLVPYILGRAYRASCDLTLASQSAAEMERIGRAADNVMTITMALCERATIFKLRGQLRQAAVLYHQAERFVTERGDRNFVTMALIDVGLADLLREQNQLEAARGRVGRVVDILEHVSWGGAPTDLVLGYTVLARVLQAQGDADGAFDALLRAEGVRRLFNDFPGFQGVIHACQVRLWLARGNLDKAVHWSRRVTRDLGDGRALLVDELRQIMLARVRMAQAKLDEALDLLARLGEATQAGGRGGRLIEILVLQALALSQSSRAAQALTTLEQALALAEPEGFVRIFLDEGQPMAHLLAQVTGDRHAYAAKLLGMFPVGRRPSTADYVQPAAAADALIEPLSARELQVLALIGEGYSNHEIAEKLVVTLNTVKKHTSNIYGKLEVRSRTQAIARAREFGLI